MSRSAVSGACLTGRSFALFVQLILRQGLLICLSKEAVLYQRLRDFCFWCGISCLISPLGAGLESPAGERLVVVRSRRIRGEYSHTLGIVADFLRSH